MPQIQQIQPSRVVHELISQRPGTYLIRAATDNDYLLSQLRIRPPSDVVLPFVVLSVRVDDNHLSPIMHYRLALSCSNDQDNHQNLLRQYEQYRDTTGDSGSSLPPLTEELIVANEDCDWKIDPSHLLPFYNFMYPPSAPLNQGQTQCVFPERGVSVEVFKKAFNNNPQGFRRELAIVKDLCYFHVASFYGITSESTVTSSLIFAYHGRSLKERPPLGIGPDQLSINRLALIGYQIAAGMMYLEGKHIVHRDLHAGNILEDDRHFIRIIDFGHAIVRNDHEQQSTAYNEVTRFQTRRLAPECLASPPTSRTVTESEEDIYRRFSTKSDVWALALIFIELTLEDNSDVYSYLLRLPQHEHEAMVRHVKINREIHKKPPKCPPAIYEILKQCWEYLPEDRLSFTDIRRQMFQLVKPEDP